NPAESRCLGPGVCHRVSDELGSHLPGPVVLQYGFRVAVIEAVASPHLSLEGEGRVPLKMATPSFMRPATCQVTFPHDALDIVSASVMALPIWLSVQCPPL